jgi:putative quorum-sensing-regulated virulence factor
MALPLPTRPGRSAGGERKVIPTKMPFGKYKGEKIEDLPTDYIEWCLSEIESLSPSLQAEMEAQLEARQGHGIVRRAAGEMK